MKFKNVLLIILPTFWYILLYSCRSADIEKPGVIVNYGNNINILVDFSNRILNNRPLSDTDIINEISDNLKPIIERSIERQINDKFFIRSINSSVLLDSTFSNKLMKIDLTGFKSQELKRSDYLYDRTEVSYTKDVQKIKSNFNEVYNFEKGHQQKPADIWYFLKDEITPLLIDTTTVTFQNNNKIFKKKYKNTIILLTDGYIEAGRYGEFEGMKENNQFRYLSQSLIDELRIRFVASKEKEMEDFFKKNNYGIIPVNNPLLKDCRFLILEFYDRSKKNGASTKTPTDFEIMKYFWKDWLIKSGVEDKDIEIYETMNNRDDVKKVFNTFINK